jgi:hypothetical protein
MAELDQNGNVQYDPNVIRDFAGHLYDRARNLVFSHVMLGILAGIIGGFVFGVQTSVGGGAMVAILLCGIFAWVGYMIASPKAFLLRLQAQSALCQVQIEVNTRTAAQSIQQRAA